MVTGKASGGVTVIKDAGHHAVMELVDYCNECAWTAEFSHDFPKSVPADSVEKPWSYQQRSCRGRGAVPYIFPEVDGQQISCWWFSASAEATLTFREKTLLQVVQQAVEKDAGQDLACYGEEGDCPVVVAGLAMHHGQT